MQPNATLLNYFFPCCSIQDKRMADLEPLEWQKQLCDTSFDWFALSYEFTDLAMTRKDTLNIIWLHLVACTSQFPCFSGCRCVGQLMNLALYENFHPLNLCSSSGTIIEMLELCPYPKLRSAKDLRNSWSWRRCSDYEGEITLFFLEQNPPLFMLKILNPVFTAKCLPLKHNITFESVHNVEHHETFLPYMRSFLPSSVSLPERTLLVCLSKMSWSTWHDSNPDLGRMTHRPLESSVKQELKTYKNPTTLSHCLNYLSLDLPRDSKFHPLTPYIQTVLGFFP